MSVEHEAKLTIGWRVEQDEIPDFDERWGSEWEELEELAQKASELLGRHVWQGELCEVSLEQFGKFRIGVDFCHILLHFCRHRLVAQMHSSPNQLQK